MNISLPRRINTSIRPGRILRAPSIPLIEEKSDPNFNEEISPTVLFTAPHFCSRSAEKFHLRESRETDGTWSADEGGIVPAASGHASPQKLSGEREKDSMVVGKGRSVEHE